MIFEPSKYDLRNISPILPSGTKNRFKSPKFEPTMGLESVNNVGQGVSTPQTLQTANKSGSTSEVKPSTPKLALELPSMELGGGIRTEPVRMEIAPVAPKPTTNKQK